MTLLALESTASVAGVALMQEGKLHGSVRIRHGLNLSGNLLHATEWLLERANLHLEQVSAIAVDVGPGAFTGLKIGVVIAKSWAHALGIDLVAVDAFSAVAFSAPAGLPTLIALPARRDALYLRWCLPRLDTEPELLGEPAMIVQSALGEWVARTRPPEAVVQVVGTERAYEWLSPLLPSARWQIQEAPSPEGVAFVGWHRWRQGKTVHPFQLVPMYIQPPSITMKKGSGE